MAIKYSRIIAGTMNWGRWGASLSQSEIAHRIASCAAMGITSFDHADIYGNYTTEAAFGAGFKASGVPREKLQFISKCGIALVDKKRGTHLNHYNYTRQYILDSVARSLEKLQTSYLDLLLLHRPSPLINPVEIQEVVDLLLKKGYIKSFGVSNFTPSQVDLIQKTNEVSANQIEISLAVSAPMFNGQLDHSMTHNILPMAWAPLGGLMVEKSVPHALGLAFKKLCKKYETTTDSLLLAWLLVHPSCIHPVIGTTQITRQQAAVDACSIHIEVEDWFYLLAAFRGYDIP